MIRVVVVDDEKVIREGIGRFIKETKGYELTAVCENGEEAYEVIMQAHPDLVISDILMPVCDGIELIGRCRESEVESEFILLSGYSEFEYARAALRFGVLDYINKPVNRQSLQELLEKARKVILDKQLVKKQLYANLYEKALESEHIEEEARQVLELPEEKKHRVLVLNLIPGPGEGNRAQVQTEFLAFCEKQLKRTAAEDYMLYVRKGLVVVILMGEDTEPESIEAFCREIFCYAKGHGGRGYVGAGELAPGMGKIPDSFQKARAALYAAQQEGKALCFFEQLPYSYEKPSRTWGMDISGVLSAIHLREASQVQKEVRRLTQKYQVFSPPYVIYAFVLRVAAEMIEETAEDTGSMGKKARAEALAELASAENLEVLVERFEGLTGELLGKAEEHYGSSIDEVLGYIYLHYTGDISIEKICSVFYFNQSYFSALFKQKTGWNYNDFVTDLRIRKAKELLHTGSYKINEIAELVGYNSSRYFSRVFKTKTGMLPQEYKKEKQKNSI